MNNGTSATLAMQYAGNQLTRKGTSAYAYDANGNMITDNSKNISNIQYNILNLPERVQFSSGGVASYVYDAAGVKRQAKHQGAGVSQTTDYCGNVIYENGTLSRILTEEGYITLSGTTPTYHYYLKDHLGNNRVVLNQDGTTVEQVNHYYPFGGVFDQTAEATQPYKFGGKELDRTYGLDLYDFEARYMDGALGRFTTMDPLAEKYYGVSPYAYCAGNPVNRIDPDGRDWYTNKQGEFFWQEGNKKIDGYTNIGNSVSIQTGKDTYINYYQNAGIRANQALNAFDLISQSGKLQNDLLGKNSVLSKESQSALYNGLVSQSVDAFARPIGEAGLEYGAGAVAGAVAGKAISWGIGKIAGKMVVESVKTGANTFFEGAKYSHKVLRQMNKADDIYHAFPRSVDGYAAKFGQWSTKIGTDGKVYQWLKMPGNYGGKTGTFEYTKNAKGLINHRFFKVQ